MQKPTTGWLIERRFNDNIVWWRSDLIEERDWTDDASQAVRFSRQQDAELVIRSGILRTFWLGAFATEHMWYSADSAACEEESKD